MRYLCSVLILFTFIIPQFSHAADVNAGFVQGLWYSSPEFFAGTPVRIYVALRNNTAHDLTATIRFTDNGKRIGSSDVHALSGRLVEAWVDWTPTQGEHTILATVSDATLHIIGGGTEPITIAETLAEDSVIVDIDTDKDGVGNTKDTDDDNDDVTDVDEVTRGSDPLVPNPKAVPKKVEKEEIAAPLQKAETEGKTTPEAQSANLSEAVGGRGIEEYIDNNTAAALLSNVTDKVETAKDSLDTYREKRNEEIAARASTEQEVVNGTGINNDTATITRTKIEPKESSLLQSFIASVRSILESVWTFILWTLSKILTHPALIQFLLLLGILYILYRVIRRVGRRPMT
jgi:hypothetical protein